MSSYPKIYKAEALMSRHGDMYVALYEAESGFDLSMEGFREGNGPNYLFEFAYLDPACPGFTTLLDEARHYHFRIWDSQPYAVRIPNGEAPVERHSMLEWGGHLVASWEGNAKKVSIHDQDHATWANK